MSHEEYYQRLATGEVVKAGDAVENDRVPDTRHLDRIAFRRKLIASVRKHRASGMTFKDSAEAARRECREAGHLEDGARSPSDGTIRRWMMLEDDGDATALEPRYHRCGNRDPRHDVEFEEIALDVIETQYLTSDRLTVTQIAARAGQLYLEACEADGRSPRPHGRRIVERLIAQLPHHDVVKRRHGRKEARRRMRTAKTAILVDKPYDRIEIDCTVADVFVRFGAEAEVARPTVCAAIDVASGQIVGLQTSLRPAHGMLVARTLKEVLEPKDAGFFDLRGIENRFHTVGRPALVVCDQGSENVGPEVDALIENAGITQEKLRPGSPEGKPFVERLLREVGRFCQTLPGATVSADTGKKERTDRAMKEAVYTLEQFEHLLQKWRFDTHAVTSQRRIQSAIASSLSPKECLRELDARHVRDEPPTPRERLAIFMSTSTERRLQFYGIEVEGLQYHSHELESLYRDVGPSARVSVRHDVTDLRAILVRDPRTEGDILVPCKDETMPALTLTELRERRRKPPERRRADVIAQGRAVGQAVASGDPPASPPARARKEARDRARAGERERECLRRTADVPRAQRLVDPQPSCSPGRSGIPDADSPDTLIERF